MTIYTLLNHVKFQHSSTINYRVSQKKYTCLMSHNTAAIGSILNIRLGLLDRQDFKLNYDTINVYLTSLLTGLLMQKPAAPF